MKYLFHIAILFPAMLFAQTKGNFHVQAVFEENKGQVQLQTTSTSNLIIRGARDVAKEENPVMHYVLRSAGLTYYFSDRGYSVVQKNEHGFVNRVDFFFKNEIKSIPQGDVEIGSKQNYYLASGNFTARKFNKLIYRNVAPGCDLEFSIVGNSLERKLIMKNGICSAFSFDVIGAEFIPTEVDGQVGYTFTSAAGTFSEKVVSQDNSIVISNNRFYSDWIPDRTRPEYVFYPRASNPNTTTTSTISWMTYLGGNNDDELFGITLAPDSGVVVTGRTASLDFPSTPGSMQDTLALSYDAVVTRFDKNGNCLWSTFYGGTNFDGAYQLISLGSNFVVAGMSSSTDLPMLNPTQIANAGSYDAFLLVLNSAGQMVRSTYYGGSGGDMGYTIAKGPLGEIVVGGSSTSTNLPFTATGYQNTMAGQIDAFLTVFDASLNVQWSTYYGGSNPEDIHALTVTPLGEIVFVGATRSIDFPVTANAWQGGLLNMPDNYLVKFGMNGARHYATFFGGTNTEDAYGIAGDSTGCLYMTGFTYSADFPIQGTSFQSTILGQEDAYVSKFDSTGQLVWSTFVGSGGRDIGWGIVSAGKYLYICGETDNQAFPVSANAIQSTIGLNSDGFVIKMDTAGQMVSGTFMGGNGVDALYALTLDADTNVFATGDAYSTDLPISPGAYQMTNATNGDAYVVKFGMSEQLVSTSVIIDHENPNLSVFPNPFCNAVTISSSDALISKIELFDETGRLLLNEKENSLEVKMDLSGFSKGVYLMKVTDANSYPTLIIIVRN